MSYSKPTIVSKHYASFAQRLPRQEGRTVAITGTTSGTGFVAARTAAELGARVLLLNRESTRASSSLDALRSAVPQGDFEPVVCDLQSFASVRTAAQRVHALCPSGLDVLCNNAGVMALEDVATADGFDVQMQTNHLSHFLLTKLLWPLLEQSTDARVVNHSSIARLSVKTLEARYLGKNGGSLGGNGSSMLFGGARWVRYGQTKLANAAFTAALHARAQQAGSSVKALVAHPGLANTELQVTSIREGGMGALFTGLMMRTSQSSEDGALGILSGMFLPEAESGQFWGPGASMMAMKGPATSFPLERRYDNEATRELLWAESCKAIGEDFELSAPAT